MKTDNDSFVDKTKKESEASIDEVLGTVNHYKDLMDLEPGIMENYIQMLVYSLIAYGMIINFQWMYYQESISASEWRKAGETLIDLGNTYKFVGTNISKTTE
jgi:hypothetical protein